MATTISGFNHAFPFSAPDTYNYTPVQSGTHTIAVKLTDYITLAGISITIKNGATTLATLAAGQTGGELNLQAATYATSASTLTVIVASTTSSDTLVGQIRGYITITRTAG